MTRRTAADARHLAARVHDGQTYGDLPYLAHLDAVALLVRLHGGSDAAIAAAYLHDTLEDTELTLDALEGLHGPTVARMVWACTGEGTTRAERQATILARLVRDDVPPEARLVKLADRYANLAAAVDGRPDKAAMYRMEHYRFRDALRRRHEWPGLWRALDDLTHPPPA